MTIELSVGHHESVPINDYHADREWLTSSMLKRFDESPRLYDCEKEFAETSSTRIGRAVHAYALNDDHEMSRIVHFPDRRCKAYKDFAAEHDVSKFIVLNEAERRISDRCVEALYEDGSIFSFLEKGGYSESTLCWCDHLAIRCKARPDLFNLRRNFICDIKTISSFSYRDIMRSIEKYRYHLQAAHYLSGVSHLFNKSIDDLIFVFCFVETCAPYRTAAITLDDYTISRSFDKRFELLERLKFARDTDEFEDPLTGKLTTLTLPERCYE